MGSALQKAAARLCTGALVLLRRPGEWVMAGEDLETRGWRAFGVLGGGAWGGAAVYTERELMWLVVGGAAVLAYRAGRPPKDEEDRQNEEPEESTAGPGVPELVAAMHALADPHVHLSALAAHLGFGKDTAPIRALLEEARVEVKPGVRMGGKVSTGVDQADFPPLPYSAQETPEGALTSNNNSNNALIVEKREGMTIIREPSETARRRGVVPRH